MWGVGIRVQLSERSMMIHDGYLILWISRCSQRGGLGATAGDVLRKVASSSEQNDAAGKGAERWGCPGTPSIVQQLPNISTKRIFRNHVACACGCVGRVDVPDFELWRKEVKHWQSTFCHSWNQIQCCVRAAFTRRDNAQLTTRSWKTTGLRTLHCDPSDGQLPKLTWFLKILKVLKCPQI